MSIVKLYSLCFLLLFGTFAFSPSAFAFGPCSRSMPDTISYIPSLPQCDGKAAIILNGRLRNSFSVVVRACDNGDRDPCYHNPDSCATATSSPFKVQKVISAVITKNGQDVPAKIHCLKERGDSFVYKMVRRMTIKRVDPVRNPARDVLKICLSSRTTARHEYPIVSTGTVRNSTNFGYTPICRTQQYLGCDLQAMMEQLCSF